MGLDFDYARKVIEAEGEAICAMVHIVDESFAAAAEIIFNCRGSVIVTGWARRALSGQR